MLAATLVVVLLVVTLAVWMPDADADGDPVVDGPADAPRTSMSVPSGRDDDEAASPPASGDVVRPLAPPVGRRLAVDALEPVRAYDRQVLLAPDANYVSSRVLDADGAPVPDARVVLFRVYSGNHGERGAYVMDETVTDADGRFEVGRDESDWYASHWTRDWRLSVEAAGRPRWHGYPVPFGAPPDVVLPRAVPVELVLRLDDGTPLSGAAVHEHFILVSERFARDVAPLWAWGTTDADGRLAVLLAEDHLDPLVRIDHPDHASTRRLPPADPEGRVELTLATDRAIDVVWTGDREGWEARGLRGGHAWLAHVNHPERGWGFGVAPERFRVTERTEGHTQHFEHLSDEPVVLTNGFRGPVLLDGFVPVPGRSRFEFPLPPLERFVPGESSWGARLRVTETGPPVRAPRTLVLTGADGTVQEVSNWTYLVAGGRPLQSTLAPPVTMSFAEWGPDGPRVTGVGPGDEVELIVDGARALDWSAAVRVDTRLLDEARAANARLFLKRASVKGYPADLGLHVLGLAPGRWEYSLRGDGILRLDGELDLVVGQEAVLEPEPDAWPGVDPRPHDLRDPHARVEGRVVVEGDPWTHASRVLLVPLDDVEGRSQETADVRGGSFRLAVPPGRYRVEVLLERNRYPELSLAQGFGVEDDHRVQRGEAVLDPPVELVLADGERRTLELPVSAGPPRGRIVARVTLDGGPAPTTDADWGSELYYTVQWEDAEGRQAVDGFHALDEEGRLRVSVPPGPGTLRLLPRPETATSFPRGLPDPVVRELDAPPPRDADGNPQALEVDLDLRSPEPAADDDGSR